MRAIDSATISMRVTAAIEQLYDAFRAPVPAEIKGCPCCIKTRGTDILLSTPLRELSGIQLWRYISGSFLTIGSIDDFKYLLPRIMELAINEAEVPDTEIILSKLRLANWHDWPSQQHEAVGNLILTWFEHALIRDVEYYETLFTTESLLRGAALAGFSLSPMLEMLRQPFADPLLIALKTAYPDSRALWWKDPAAAEGYAELLAFLSGR